MTRFLPLSLLSPGTLRRRLATAVFGPLLAVAGAACGGGGPDSLGIVTPPPPPPPAPPVRAAKWALAWSDEFDGTTIDPKSWIVNDGAANVNNELEYYTPEDAYLENGALVLRTQKRRIGGRSYSSGEIRSGALRTVQRGNAVEWRTHVPSGQGIWPANWLVASACDGLNGCGANWPPEIDVLEMRGQQPNINVMTHWWGSYPNQGFESSTHTSATSFAGGYHDYRLEWYADSILWSIDGVVQAKHIRDVTVGQLQLVMNTAVGGDFVGRPDETTVFPQYHRIEYVRVYKDTANTY